MGTCEPGQGRKSAAISSHLFVRWASHVGPRDATHSFRRLGMPFPFERPDG